MTVIMKPHAHRALYVGYVTYGKKSISGVSHNVQWTWKKYYGTNSHNPDALGSLFLSYDFSKNNNQ